MNISGFEKLSLVDFDNYTSCTLFTEGCNFRCPFCHNGPLVLHKNPTYSEEEIFSYLIKRRNLLDAVCISGGEPTLQQDLPMFLSKIKELNYLTKLDTNGTNPEMLELLIEKKLVDYVAMDIKSSCDGYGKAVGISGYQPKKVLRSIEILKESSISYEFRTTLVSELITKKDIEKIADHLAGSPKYALQKFKEVDGCIEKGYTEVPKDVTNEYKSILESRNINVILRGYD